MNLPTFFFFFIMTVINVVVLNQNVKDHDTLARFVENIKVMSNAYKEMATKYNEVAKTLNSMIRTGNYQADIIEGILRGLLADRRLAPEALQWLTEAQNKAMERLAAAQNESEQETI